MPYSDDVWQDEDGGFWAFDPPYDDDDHFDPWYDDE